MEVPALAMFLADVANAFFGDLLHVLLIVKSVLDFLRRLHWQLVLFGVLKVISRDVADPTMALQALEIWKCLATTILTEDFVMATTEVLRKEMLLKIFEGLECPLTLLLLRPSMATFLACAGLLMEMETRTSFGDD